MWRRRWQLGVDLKVEVEVEVAVNYRFEVLRDNTCASF